MVKQGRLLRTGYCPLVPEADFSHAYAVVSRKQTLSSIARCCAIEERVWLSETNAMLKLLSGSCARARFASARAADSAASSGATRPFEEIPSSKMSLTKTALVVFDLIRGKPPDLASLMKSNQQAHGNIFNVSFGPVPMTVVLRPEDVEAVFRIDGKVPIRDAMPIWVDAMKTLGRDLTLFHRLVVSGKKLLHGAGRIH